jgi:hypothetical protein
MMRAVRLLPSFRRRQIEAQKKAQKNDQKAWPGGALRLSSGNRLKWNPTQSKKENGGKLRIRMFQRSSDLKRSSHGEEKNLQVLKKSPSDTTNIAKAHESPTTHAS